MNEINLPPQNLDAERSVLGALLIGSVEFEKILPLLLPADSFYSEAHILIYTVMGTLHNAGDHIDTLSVIELLMKTNFLDKAGGSFYVTGLPEGDLSSPEIKAQLIANLFLLRTVIKKCNELVEFVFKWNNAGDS